MEFYKAVNTRRTIRDFTSDEIPDEALKRIITAGMQAPTNDHMRDWHFIVITDKNVAAKCIEHIPEHFSEAEINAVLSNWNLTDECQQNLYKNAIPKQYRMLLDAPCMVIPLLKQKTDIMHPETLSSLNGFASIWCCIENIFLAATAEEYGCTLRIPLGDESEWARETLGFPKDYLMPCFLAIGKPRADVKLVKQQDIAVESRIHFNKW